MLPGWREEHEASVGALTLWRPVCQPVVDLPDAQTLRLVPAESQCYIRTQPLGSSAPLQDFSQLRRPPQSTCQRQLDLESPRVDQRHLSKLNLRSNQTWFHAKDAKRIRKATQRRLSSATLRRTLRSLRLDLRILSEAIRLCATQAYIAKRNTGSGRGVLQSTEEPASANIQACVRRSTGQSRGLAAKNIPSQPA